MAKLKAKQWDKRKAKKARFKRSIARAKRRGETVYGGYVKISNILN